jgi:hypothetical protein
MIDIEPGSITYNAIERFVIAQEDQARAQERIAKALEGINSGGLYIFDENI